MKTLALSAVVMLTLSITSFAQDCYQVNINNQILDPYNPGLNSSINYSTYPANPQYIPGCFPIYRGSLASLYSGGDNMTIFTLPLNATVTISDYYGGTFNFQINSDTSIKCTGLPYKAVCTAINND